jgi:Zn-dependent M28 family amino/carboxypeptidase
MRLRSLTVTAVLSLAVHAPLYAQAKPAAAGALVSPAEKAAAGQIRADLIRGHIRFLAHDLLEGRGPATRGDNLAQAYIAAQFEAEGLQPAGPDGSWRQTFDLVGVRSRAPETTSLRKDGQSVDLRFREEYVAVAGAQDERSELSDAELVFVGYGIQAPEFQWDDFKGMDLKGKVLVVMNNDPEDDPALFGGKTRLYYGRWDYKFDSAARQGAAGAIIIHTTPSAGYGFNVIQSSWTGEQFGLPYEGGPKLAVKSWMTDDAARRVVKLGGQDLDALRAAAQKRDFKPVPLGVRWSIAVTAEVQRKQSANVLGRLPGRDPALAQEVVIFSAHHDHLGMRDAKTAGEDVIYNGASDNASGVAALLSILRAVKALPQAPRRTILFAALAAEEQGLLGSKYYAAHPTLPPGRMAAIINMDGVATSGRTRDITMLGMGKSSLDEWIKKLVAWQDRVVVPDQFPDRGYFYRSDQFPLARIGVPAAYFDDGTQVIGKPEGYGTQKKEEYEAKHYHQPSDDLKAEWDLAGAVEDAQLWFLLGVKVANATAMPTWNPGDEFEAARKKALAEVR